MADHSKPTNTSLYTDYTSQIDARFDDITLGLDPAVVTATNLPTGAIRWNSASAKWEKWNGTAWADLASAYNINLAGPITLTANSASDAFRITQTGAGNAFVVEDSANPDGTPFVIDNTGNVIVGNTAKRAIGVVDTKLMVEAVGELNVGIVTNRADTNAGFLVFAKSRTSTLGSTTIVQTGDRLGSITFQGADGVTIQPLGAAIRALVNGTPAVGSVPGALVFETTAQDASSPTERMRIGQNGGIGIGVANRADSSFTLSKTLTGATSVFGILNNGTIQSDVTGAVLGMSTGFGTQAAAFTLTNIMHYRAIQGTFGAGSTVTNQYGFFADVNLNGATNNYGFYSNIASGTGRWNFYASGNAANYFAGDTLIGTPTAVPIIPGSFAKLQISEVGAFGILSHKYVNNVSGPTFNFLKSRGAAVGTNIVVQNGDSLGQLSYNGTDGTNIVPAARIEGLVDGTPGTNDMPGRLVFSTTASGASSPTERMRIGNNGTIGIGAANNPVINILSQKILTGGTTAYGIFSGGTVQSDVTSVASYFRSSASSAASSFTLGNLYHYDTVQGTFGAGSSVTSQYGFHAASSLTGATNNYGFYSNIASGTGRWNFYANGTARNYFAGGLEVVAGTTAMASGFTHVPAAAGVPTGAPTNPTGNVPLYYDTTNNKLYVYNGGWKSVTLT